MIADSLYIRPGRFQTAEFQEPYRDFMGKVVTILEKGRHVGFFKRAGLVTQFFGQKRYVDERITQLEEFCLDRQFKYNLYYFTHPNEIPFKCQFKDLHSRKAVCSAQ